MDLESAYARDPWLDRWQPLLHDTTRNTVKAVLELGCDTGIDTAWLLRRGARYRFSTDPVPSMVMSLGCNSCRYGSSISRLLTCSSLVLL